MHIASRENVKPSGPPHARRSPSSPYRGGNVSPRSQRDKREAAPRPAGPRAPRTSRSGSESSSASRSRLTRTAGTAAGASRALAASTSRFTRPGLPRALAASGSRSRSRSRLTRLELLRDSDSRFPRVEPRDSRLAREDMATTGLVATAQAPKARSQCAARSQSGAKLAERATSRRKGQTEPPVMVGGAAAVQLGACDCSAETNSGVNESSQMSFMYQLSAEVLVSFQ